MLTAGLIAAIVASVLFNLGIALQAIEARRTPREEALRASLIWDLLHRRLWVAGLGIEWLAVPLEILAFAWAPFVVVQPLLAWGAPGRQDTHRGAAVVIGVVVGLVLVSFILFALRGRRG